MDDAGDFVSACRPIAALRCKLKHLLVNRCCEENKVNDLKFYCFLKKDLRDVTKTLKKSSRMKTAVQNIL